ncbi:MAG: LssY C-terminal domain-containing protein [Helicobacteraceae bacterium]|nr:LssY C-terminal domain-containing protein [Helicobacteraceae bacterium]
MLPDLLNNLLPSIEHFYRWGYWIAFFAALLETVIGIGLLLPGSAVILILGTLAAHGHLDVGGILWFAITGAIIGDNINYSLGKKYGADWFKRKVWFIDEKRIEKSKQFMDSHGAKSVFLGRFIPSAKEIVPFIAGSVNMNRRTFLFWNILGAIGWGFEWVFAGYLFAQSLNLAELWLSRVGLFLTFLLFIGVIFYLLKLLIISKGRQFWTVSASIWQSVKGAAIHNKHVLLWIKEHPKIIAFSKHRIDTSLFSGLPLSLLTLTFIYIFILFAGIVEDLITSDSIVAVDIRIANLMGIFRTDTLTTVFTWITLLAKSQIILGLITVTIVFLFIWRRYTEILALLVAVAGSVTFTFLGKLAFHRPRPETAIYIENAFSFPSGHATVAVSFYGFLAYLLLRHASSWKSKVNLFFASILLISAIGISRIYLGAHYISDVWSGYLVGAMWLLIAISMSEWRSHMDTEKKARKPVQAAKPISFALLLTAIVFYVGFTMSYHLSPTAVSSQNNRIVTKAENIFSTKAMKYSESLIGEKQEAINFVISAEDAHALLKIFQDSGWVISDQASLSSFIKLIKSRVMKTPYLSAPVLPSFWNARMQDWTFASFKDQDKRTTQYIRIWRTDVLLEDGRHIYIGMANATEYRNFGVIPRLSSDIDSVRERLYRDLNMSGAINLEGKIHLVEPQIGKNVIGDQFFTDGQAYLLSIQ